MPNVRSLLRSFAGGEISPDMYGRIDDDKYQTGAAYMRNFIARAQGPAENRPGFAYVATVKDSTKKTRIIPFNFSSDDSCVIEIGAGYFRFHTNGAPIKVSGVPYEVANTYMESELFDIHYVQSNDVITFVHPNHAPATLSRTSISPLTWVLTDISILPPINPPSDVTATDNPPANDPGPTKYDYSYVVTSIFSDNTSQSIASNPATIRSNLNETGRTVTIKWTAVPNASRYYVYKLQCGVYGYIGEIAQSSGVLSITDENIAPDMSVTPPIYEDAFNTAAGIASIAVTSGGTGYGSTKGQITTTVATVIVSEDSSGAASAPSFTIVGTGTSITPAVITTHIDTVTNTKTNLRTYTCTLTFTSAGLNYDTAAIAMLFRTVTYYGPLNTSLIQIPALQVRPSTVVLRVNDSAGSGSGANISATVVGGVITGITVISPGSGYVSPYVTIVDSVGGSGATFGTPVLTAFAGDYPGAVSYFEQRKCFAGTPDHPSKIWMTRSGTENNMSYSIPLRDDDRISFQVAARESNTIRHIVPLTQLLLLTNSAEWRVSSVNSDVLTPDTISVRPQSYIGASNVQPSVINNTLVYCASRGGHIRECGYNWQAQGFVTGDLSLRASHLFDNLEIKDMCYSKAPQPLLWFVSSNGKLLGLTYIPEQSVGAWHQHDTDGTFESCTVVSEGSEDVLYVVVRRLVNGTYRRYIERMQTRNFTSQQTAFFVDSGVSYDGTNTGSTTVTVTGGTAWTPAEELTITASSAIFTMPAADVNNVIVLTDTAGIQYRLRIVSQTSTTVAKARVDKTLGTSFRGVATTSWAWAKLVYTGLTHLVGKTVSILGDGAVLPQAVVSSTGTVTLTRPATKVIIGLPYQSDLKTLPLALQVDGFGQGRMKNVNKVWMRVNRSSGIFVGPDAENLTEAKQRTTEPYGSPPALKTEEILVMITPSWADSGSIYIRQIDPLPLTIVNMTMEVTLGA